MNNSAVFLVCLALILGPSVSDASTAFTLSNGPSCSNGLSLALSDWGCDGSSQCDLGDTADFTGTLTIPEYFPDEVTMHVKACILSISTSMTCREFDNEAFDFCDVFGAGGDCPNAGDYDAEGEVVLPGSGGNQFGYGWWVKVTATLYDEDGNQASVCTARIDAVNSSGSSSSYAYFLGFSSLGVLGLASLIWIRTRRRTGVIDLTEEEDQVVTGDFEMMRDSPQQKQPVTSYHYQFQADGVRV